MRVENGDSGHVGSPILGQTVCSPIASNDCTNVGVDPRINESTDRWGYAWPFLIPCESEAIPVRIQWSDTVGKPNRTQPARTTRIYQETEIEEVDEE